MTCLEAQGIGINEDNLTDPQCRAELSMPVKIHMELIDGDANSRCTSQTEPESQLFTVSNTCV